MEYFATTFGNAGYQGTSSSSLPTNPTIISAVAFTADLTSGSQLLTNVTNLSNIAVNDVIIGSFGSGLDSEATVMAINIDAAQITIDTAPTISATGATFHIYPAEHAYDAYLKPSALPSSATAGNLGAYAISIVSPNNGTKQFTVDTSFEPYRREAFRHRTIPAQRQSIMMTNIAGQGTVNTEGLWRREQTEWSMGAGQLYLDRKSDSQETRFYKSKGIDVFSYPLQATLLPDTERRDDLGSAVTTSSGILMSRCGDYTVVSNGTGSGLTITCYATNVGVFPQMWGSSTGKATFTFDLTTYEAVSGTPGTTPTHVYSMDTNDTYVYIATDTGIWFGQASTSSPVFQLYVAPEPATLTSGASNPYTGGYDMVRWTNDQLIASRKNRLYAFQPRSGTTYPYFGIYPTIADVQTQITNISMSGGTATVTTGLIPHNLTVGQPITITNSATSAPVSGIALASGVMTVTCSTNHGLSVGESFTLKISGTTGFTETGTVRSVTSNTVFTYNTGQLSITTAVGTVTGSENYGYNASYAVATVPSTTTFTISVPTSLSALASGGTVVSSLPPDMLYTHVNSNWIWSDATGGETQVYFSGYIKSSSGKCYAGCIYRSNLPGASTTSNSNLGITSTSNVVQPWNLSVPIQALPMSPDEYPTCIQSYLNFTFIGTNRGIRMTQTLSIYDPTATATGDLKSGPLIPNILQPVTMPVTAIVGDGRYVWFAWNNYDDSSTGLGKLDLQTYIAGDPLAPSYSSDVMVTGQGVINSLDWDPYYNIPLMAINGLGVWSPMAANEGGSVNVYRYVTNGSITSGIFDYGIPDKKIPVFFDYGAISPVSQGTSVQAFVDIDPGDEDAAGFQVISSYPQDGNTSITEFTLPQYKAEQFQVSVTLTSDETIHANTPILHRWTLKSWPAAVSGTSISVVLQLYSVNVVDGMEVFVDPYASFIWLENLRQAQDIIKYQEGPLAVNAIIEGLDWIPHKRRDNYENGFEGDCVITMKTIGQYEYIQFPTESLA